MRRAQLMVMAAAILLLAGCSNGDETASGASSAPTLPASSPAPTATATPSPTPRQDTAEFVGTQQALVAGYGVDLTREQVEAAVEYTCAQKAAGLEAASIEALPAGSPELANETVPGRANSVLVNNAWDFYCLQ